MEHNKVFEGMVRAPEFPGDIDWINSRPLWMPDLRGKFVLLDFWTYCCINCLHILPELKRLEREFARELVVIGVHSAKFHNERQTEQIRQAVSRLGIEHPVMNDAAFQLWQTYVIRAWPTVVLINPEGGIIGSMAGENIYPPISTMLRDAIPYFEAKGSLDRSPLELSSEPDVESVLAYPGKVIADEASGRIFLSDTNHNRILVLKASGQVLDVIGSGEEGRAEGSFGHAKLNRPQGMALAGSRLYIADTENHLIRCADLESRTVTTVLGTGEQAREMNVPGTGREVPISSPWDLAVAGESLYIAMAGTHQIWIADRETWQAEPSAGTAAESLEDGWRKTAVLAQPSGLSLDGGNLYFADSESSAIRVVSLTDGQVRTLVGKGLFEFGDIDGYAAQARLQHPLGVAARNGKVYVADTYNSKIKLIDPAGGTSRTIAGTGNPGYRDGRCRQAEFNEPGGIAFLGDALLVADTNNHCLRRLDFGRGEISTIEIAGD